ncbi:MAG TPA: ABC transporter permease [Gemmatimonadales bacterium]|nr:ABC transporter permease [Gemmatimonadales bacterium]
MAGVGRLREYAVPALIVAGAIAALAAALGIAGYDPELALGALWRGSVGSFDAFASGTLVRAVPLIIIALGFALALRGGMLNIGAEGQFLAGAVAATWLGTHLAGWPALLAIPATWLVALAAGLLWIVVPVVLRVKYGVLEVITTLLLNFVAEALVSFMVQGPLQEQTGIYPQSDPIAEAARLPLLPGTRLHLGIGVALILAVVLWFFFARTLAGFRLLAAGSGPRAAALAGRIDVTRMAALALLVSGALAGLAGATEVGGVSYALYPNLSPGYGFTAIAVALLARLHPPAIVVTGILFGALETGAGAMQRDAGIPAVVVQAVEAAIILALLLADARTHRGRAYAGAAA